MRSRKSTLYTDIPPPESPIPLRCEKELPRYRYVPGLHPHPSKHPLGHYQTNPPITLDSQVSDWSKQPGWLRGLDLFDHRFYWECHEQLEAIWHRLDSDDAHRTFVQGIIQAAAFRLKWHMGHQSSAMILKSSSETRLRTTQDQIGNIVWSIDIAALIGELGHVQARNHWPTLTTV